eukprot:COSAG06_NODE_1763_length_8449_cov_184.922275_14_plen_74_part_00
MAKSEDAALALCKLHGQINANVIIEGASLVQSGDGADAHSLQIDHRVLVTVFWSPCFGHRVFRRSGCALPAGV